MSFEAEIFGVDVMSTMLISLEHQIMKFQLTTTHPESPALDAVFDFSGGYLLLFHTLK
jgi:hypothetical protein